MTTAAKRPCNHPGCGVLLPYGERYCAPHQKARQQRSDDQRGNSSERGYTSAWQRARAAYLSAHPLCVKHEAKGEVVAASVVDHIIPHRGNWTVFWDSTNWQSLCKQCHDIKTATHDGAFGR